MRKKYWNGGHGDSRISESCGSHLVALATDTARTHLDGFSNDPADGKRNVLDFNAGDDAKTGIKNQAEDCPAQSKGEAANKDSVSVPGNLVLELINAALASQCAIDAKILARYALVARLAHVRAGFWRVFRRANCGAGLPKSESAIRGRLPQRLRSQK